MDETRKFNSAAAKHKAGWCDMKKCRYCEMERGKAKSAAVLYPIKKGQQLKNHAGELVLVTKGKK